MEGQLIEKRLSREKHPNKMFFSYANTVATIDFAKQFKGHGWVGIRYQIEPDEDYNELYFISVLKKRCSITTKHLVFLG
jgi:hypothetical protein